MISSAFWGQKSKKNMYKTHANKNIVSDFIRKSHPNKYKKNVPYLLLLKIECVQKENKYYKIFKKNCILITKNEEKRTVVIPKAFRYHSDTIPKEARRRKKKCIKTEICNTQTLVHPAQVTSKPSRCRGDKCCRVLR